MKDINHKYYNLTQPQMAIWHTEKVFPATPYGNLCAVINLKGHMDYKLFTRAVNAAVQKNDGYRLHFEEINSNIKQYITPYKPFIVDYIDFSQISEISEINENLPNEEPFNLINSDLFYFAVYKVDEDNWGFYFKTHHLISDACTVVTQTNKIIEDYYTLLDGGEISLEPEPSYIEYIESEQEYKLSEKYQKHKEYWAEKLSTIPEFFNFKPAVTARRSLKSNRISLKIGKELSSSINKFCSQNKTSPFIVFLSILYILINRITSSADITLGVPTLNRSNFREKRMVGMFKSVIPVRYTVDCSKDFTSFVKALSKEWETLLSYQKFPYSKIRKAFCEKHKINENLFDIVLSYQNAKFNKSNTTEKFNLIWHHNRHQTESLQIHINDHDDSGEYEIDIDYLVDLISSDEAGYIGNGYINLLSNAMSNLEKKLAVLDVISNDEKHLFARDLEASLKDKEINTTIHDIFEKRSKSMPDNTAVIFEESQITYSELNSKANALARKLTDNGIGPDCVVALMAEPSLEMVIGILGILKSGGAYLPIDPSYPDNRIRYMLNDSKASIMLVNCNMYKSIRNQRFKSEIYFNGLVLDLRDKALYEGEISDVINVNTPYDLAYVIYTSGSTGEPKGVMVEHRSVVNYARWKISSFPISSSDKILQLVSFSFDGFGANLYPAILSGASLVLANNYDRYQYAHIPGLIKDKGITIMSVIPMIYKEILNNTNPEDKELNRLRMVALGGERSSSELIKLSNHICPSVVIVNEYGPTESSIASISYFGMSADETDIIGRTINNTSVCIVNKYDSILPFNTPGELCLMGACLARGYLGKVNLTRERFVPCPLNENEIMYRTGDLAIMQSDENIKFLGRVDNQVKIRGIRIELGEIENKIKRYKDIDDACVIYKEDDAGNRYLCAYFVSSTRKIEHSEIRQHLFKILPGYMVPSYFVQLEKFPLTPNGKIDKKILPSEAAKRYINKAYTAPENDIEVKLVAAFSKVLSMDNMDKIGTKDNIFDYGIDSLAIMRVMLSVKQYGWDINMQDFYEHQTIKHLSNKIAEIKAASTKAENTSLIDYHEPRNILLTGATGYLGAHLLDSIIKNTECYVYCLVRSPDRLAAYEKLSEKLNFYFGNIYEDLIGNRIMIVNGDIRHENLGLCWKEYKALSDTIDTVIHSAALVKHFGSYRSFESVNVFGTQNIINFCLTCNAKLRYISTISVSGSSHDQKQGSMRFTENDIYIGQNIDNDVYASSKLEAEKLLYKFSQEGLDVSIFRVGNLTGRYSDGQFRYNINENSFYNILRFATFMKVLSPEIYNLDLEFSPVDIIADTIIKLIGIKRYSKPENLEKALTIFHLYNDKKIKMSDVLEISDKKRIMIDNALFKDELNRMLNDNIYHSLISDVVYNLDSIHNSEPAIDVSCDITKSILIKKGIDWPQINRDYLYNIFKYMCKVGFINI